mgnify:CR=1 FL=1
MKFKCLREDILSAIQKAEKARNLIIQKNKWWTNRDSNPGPTGYEPVALTN